MYAAALSRSRLAAGLLLGATSVLTLVGSTPSAATAQKARLRSAATSLGVASSSGASSVRLKNVSAVSAGAFHTCALLSGGTVECWGWNKAGELGNGSTVDSRTPVTVSGITNATQISVGGTYGGAGNSCALLSGGTVECWGIGSDGQLGNGTSHSSSIPVAVSGISNATQVSVSGNHACAVLSDKTVGCWGLNGSGELGDGVRSHGHRTADGSDYSPSPVTVVGIRNATEVVTGSSFSCALISGGAVKCWGDNWAGQLGNNGSETQSRPTPVDVYRLADATQISAGWDHACAVVTGGTVKCWGGMPLDVHGKESPHPKPFVVKGIASATAVSAGVAQTCVTLSDGAAKCWGDNFLGELGNGTTESSLTPTAVSGITSAKSIGVGWQHSCAVMIAGTVECWGSDIHGELGNGTAGDETNAVAVTGITNARAISAGSYHTCALLSSGKLECWGLGRVGQLGNGTKNDSSTSVTVSGIGHATEVSAGSDAKIGPFDGGSTCALIAGGRVECWGDNREGQLGNGKTKYSLTPVRVGGIGKAVAVATAADFGCALISRGEVMCWGAGYGGRTPVTVEGIAKAGAISAGYDYACAIVPGGRVMCWSPGRRRSGAEMVIKNIRSAKAISTSGIASDKGHTCILLSNGRIECRGENQHGELGNGKKRDSPTPVAVKGIREARAISVGGDEFGGGSTCAVLARGTVECWGDNEAGQLGNGSSTDSAIPVVAKGVANAIAISVGGDHVCALRSTGVVECWGGNIFGELGNGKMGYSTTPVGVVGMP
jgi:alpha-tubulin suppressor-like RCC1 family protein